MIEIPDEWATRDAAGVPLSLRTPQALREHPPVDGTVLVAVDDSMPEQFAPSVNVVANRLEGLDAATWQEESDRLMQQVISPQVLVDAESRVLDRFRRTVRLFEDAQFGGVAMEQYAVAEHGYGVTITCSCSVLEYPELADGFVRIAASLTWGELA